MASKAEEISCHVWYLYITSNTALGRMFSDPEVLPTWIRYLESRIKYLESKLMEHQNLITEAVIAFGNQSSHGPNNINELQHWCYNSWVSKLCPITLHFFSNLVIQVVIPVDFRPCSRNESVNGIVHSWMLDPTGLRDYSSSCLWCLLQEPSINRYSPSFQ